MTTKPKAEPKPAAQENKLRPKKTIRGVVSSDKMNKSRVMTVVRRVKHPLVGKFIKRTTKYMFHDEKNESRVGDVVVIQASRPMSACKTHVLVAIAKRSED